MRDFTQLYFRLHIICKCSPMAHMFTHGLYILGLLYQKSVDIPSPRESFLTHAMWNWTSALISCKYKGRKVETTISQFPPHQSKPTSITIAPHALLPSCGCHLRFFHCQVNNSCVYKVQMLTVAVCFSSRLRCKFRTTIAGVQIRIKAPTRHRLKNAAPRYLQMFPASGATFSDPVVCGPTPDVYLH